MNTERDIARGIQRQKVAQTRANMAGGFGCVGVALVVAVVLALVTQSAIAAAAIAVVLGLAVGAYLYQRVLTKNLNR